MAGRNGLCCWLPPRNSHPKYGNTGFASKRQDIPILKGAADRSRGVSLVVFSARYVETSLEARNPPLGGVENLEHLVEAAIQVVVMTVVLDLHGATPIVDPYP